MPDPTDYVHTFESFWRELVTTGGDLDLDKVARELHDYRNVMREYNELLSHVTGGRLSKPNTDARAAASVADEHYDATFCADVAEELEGLIAEAEAEHPEAVAGLRVALRAVNHEPVWSGA